VFSAFLVVTYNHSNEIQFKGRSIPVKKLVLQARCLLIAVIVFTAALIGVLISQPPYCVVYVPIILAAGLTAFLYYTPARKNFKTAQLIVENTIIHIQSAVVFAQSVDEKQEAEKLREKFEIYVSCFGILLDTQIIIFNQNGIWLKKVEIGRDYISFEYGKNGSELQNIRLFYSKPAEEELAEIIENFHINTGVIPVIV